MIRQATAALMLAAAFTVAPVPAVAHAFSGLPGFCPDANGVTVVVDFRELGGGTVVRCAVGAPANGLAALENAGFSVAGTQRWGKGFICRIEGKPSASTEPCIDTPPTSAYWSYWHAPNGGSWSYSNFGVLNRTPPPGSFDGWAFSKDRTENSALKPGVAPNRPTPPAPPVTTAPAPPPPRPSTPKPGSSQVASAEPSAVTETSSSPAPSASLMPSVTQGWTGELAKPPPPGPGTPIGLIATAVALTGCGIAAWWIQRRRRSREG